MREAQSGVLGELREGHMILGACGRGIQLEEGPRGKEAGGA